MIKFRGGQCNTRIVKGEVVAIRGSGGFREGGYPELGGGFY